MGTRRASSYGLRVAGALGRELSAAGVIVVSGLALGIDGAAHRGALEGPGAALAVIGAGHDRPCPTRNRSLAAEVAARGLILSEVPPGVGSAPWRYPVRNRLIAAFARVVIVVESARRGGSMSTVAEALARDRAVMAVPGAVGRRSSEGCHDLLRDGAEVCTGADDVLGLLAMNQAGCGSPDSDGGVARPGLSGLERQVLEELAGDPLTVDSLVLRTGTSMGRIAGVLAGLEARGRIRSRSGWLERT
ncbi:MAG: DNA-processing protein DprA [Actinomycetia bacterium]|nr:DNA-processing protein DprA [Actinomycetes bacterium]